MGGGYNVYLVEGEYTRCGIGNDLLDHTLSIHRIICPSKDAFEKYDEIYQTVIGNVPKK